MKVISRTTHSVSIEVDGEDKELELSHAPSHGSLIEKHNEHVIVVGYLVQDEDCANPLEDCDGMGHIHSLSNRHTNHIDADEAREKLESNPFVVPLSYFEHGQCQWGVAGTMSSMPDFQWDGVSFAGIWEPDECALDEAQRRAKVYSIGEVNDLNILRGSGPKFVATVDKTREQQRFNEWHEAFAWLASKTKRKTWTKSGACRAAAELAEQACEQYTSWCNGDCWGVCVDTFDMDGDKIADDACWGHVGSDYAEQTMKEQVDSELKSHLRAAWEHEVGEHDCSLTFEQWLAQRTTKVLAEAKP